VGSLCDVEYDSIKTTYIHRLKQGTLTLQEITRLELPYSPELIEASWLCAGGTLASCRKALEDGISAHIGGGFHHSFPDHGEGFCVLNDIAIAVEKKIFVSDIETISVGLIRELVDNELFERGFNKKLEQQAVLGMSTYNLNKIIFSSSKENR